MYGVLAHRSKNVIAVGVVMNSRWLKSISSLFEDEVGIAKIESKQHPCPIAMMNMSYIVKGRQVLVSS